MPKQQIIIWLSAEQKSDDQSGLRRAILSSGGGGTWRAGDVMDVQPRPIKVPKTAFGCSPSHFSAAAGLPLVDALCRFFPSAVAMDWLDCVRYSVLCRGTTAVEAEPKPIRCSARSSGPMAIRLKCDGCSLVTDSFRGVLAAYDVCNTNAMKTLKARILMRRANEVKGKGEGEGGKSEGGRRKEGSVASARLVFRAGRSSTPPIRAASSSFPWDDIFYITYNHDQ